MAAPAPTAVTTPPDTVATVASLVLQAPEPVASVHVVVLAEVPPGVHHVVTPPSIGATVWLVTLIVWLP